MKSEFIKKFKDEINKNASTKILFIVAVVLLLGVLIEVFVFNFRSIQSLSYGEGTSLAEYDISLNGITYWGDNWYKIDEEGAYIQFSNIDIDIKNVYFDMGQKPISDYSFSRSNTIDLGVYIKDEGCGYFYNAVSRTLVHENMQSQYFALKSMGDIDEIRFYITSPASNAMILENIYVNKSRPIFFSLGRYLITVAIMLVIVGMSKISPVWKEDCQSMKGWKKWVFIGIIGLLSVGIGEYAMQNKCVGSVFYEYHEVNSYNDLAEALLSGQLNISEEPAPELLALNNPYDAVEREKTGVSFRHDYVLFNNHYYVYFGILPCLIFYIPMHAIGSSLPDLVALLIVSLIFYIGLYFLMKRIICKYYPDTKMGWFIILYSICCLGCEIPYYMNQPDIYSVPVIFGMALTVWGLYIWALIDDIFDGRKNLIYLATGSFVMALVALSRPNQLLYSFLIFPLILIPAYQSIKAKKETANGKNIVKSAVAIVIPYAVVAIAAMSYNYARFNNPFEFGATYNLTVLDMRHTAKDGMRLIMGIFDYLFMPAQFSSSFPFLTFSDIPVRQYGTGVMYTEPMLGGLISCNLILLILTALIFARKELNKNRAYYISTWMCVLSFIMLVVDIEVGGVVLRYLSDFSFMLFIACAIVILGIADLLKEESKQVMFRRIVIVLAVLCICYNILLLFVDGQKGPMCEGNTDFYYQMYYAFNFL